MAKMQQSFTSVGSSISMTSDVDSMELNWFTLVAVGTSGILKGKQKLGLTFDSDKLGSIDFTKFSKLTMCSV